MTIDKHTHTQTHTHTHMMHTRGSFTYPVKSTGLNSELPEPEGDDQSEGHIDQTKNQKHQIDVPPQPMFLLNGVCQCWDALMKDVGIGKNRN